MCNAALEDRIRRDHKLAFLAASGLADVNDAGVVLLANDGDEIVTLERDDLERLAVASG